MKKTYYWHDPINDDFAKTNINTIKLSDDYKFYSRNPSYLLCETAIKSFCFPLIWSVLKVGFIFRIKNRKVLKIRNTKGYFLYGNHTNYLLDAYAPSIIGRYKKVHIIANADAVSIKGLGWLVKMLGVIPIPSTIKGISKMKNVVESLSKDYGRVIAIYPEAHIWPYYTDVRPFGKQSFHYPVDAGLPSYAFTNIYVKRKLKFIKRPKVVSYIDGPFYPDKTLSHDEQIIKLRNDIYNAMKKRVDSNPKYNYCDYIYVEDKQNSNAKIVNR